MGPQGTGRHRHHRHHRSPAKRIGDIVFLDLPEAGRSVAAKEEVAVVESVKAASDIYAPIAGEIVAANSDAIDAPESVNTDAYATWLFKLKPANLDDIDKLLTAAAASCHRRQ